jgi:NaMN:DMB phosphoribosyltransferase
MSDISWLLKQSGDIPILAADPGLSASSILGLQPYGKGLVKEGVGAGGCCLASMLSSSGKVTTTDILNEVERSYYEIIGK